VTLGIIKNQLKKKRTRRRVEHRGLNLERETVKGENTVKERSYSRERGEV